MRIGLIGFGYIGSYLYSELTAHPEWGLTVAFVSGKSALGKVSAELHLPDLADAESKDLDLIVEAAHPQVTRDHGANFLRFADFMPLSLTALADAELEYRLRQAAEQNGTRLYIPHGAAVGLDSLSECKDLWDAVTVTMRKPPRNLDWTKAQAWAGKQIDDATVLYDGPTRGVCPLFPRNVNTHAAVALAGIGFDRTRSVLIADPSLRVSVIELQAVGAGIELHVVRSNPLQGVSGVLTARSILGSIQRVTGQRLCFQAC